MRRPDTRIVIHNMRRSTARIIVAGQPVNWLGANFWSSTGGPLMWRSYDPAVIAAELRVLREHGLTMTRSFFYWPDFMPEPDVIDEDMAARFADFLGRHAEQQMSTVPTFIVGHMSGQNWDPAWRGGRDLYADVWMVGRQAWFAGEMVRRFGPHPAVAGWLVSNEMPLYGGDHAPPGTVAAWAQIIRDAVRAAGGHQPFSLGDGSWGIEASGRDNGFRLADVARLCDFLGPHVYPVGDDQVRQHYAAAWQCELASTFGRPVVLEEFGVSSDFASDPNAARYYRHVLHHSLLAGATGWIAWNNTDFDLPGQDPYRHHAFEQHFGLTDASGAAKPTLGEMQAFAATLDAIEVEPLRADRQRRRPDHPRLPGHQLPVRRPGRPRAHRALARPGLRLGPAGRPASGADQGNQRHRRRRAAVPGALGETAARAHRRHPGAARGRRRLRLPVLFGRRDRLAPRAVVRAAGRNVRRTASARRGDGEPHRRRRGRSTSARTSATWPGEPRSRSGRRGTSTAGRSCPFSRPVPRSSPPTTTAGPRCCSGVPAGAPSCCAPTRSSTWPR